MLIIQIALGIVLAIIILSFMPKIINIFRSALSWLSRTAVVILLLILGILILEGFNFLLEGLTDIPYRFSIVILIIILFVAATLFFAGLMLDPKTTGKQEKDKEMSNDE